MNLTSYIMKLPKIESIQDLSTEINLSTKTLNRIAYKIKYYYKEYYIYKKNGNPRLISSPSKELKVIQAWILRNILDKLESDEAATGFKKRTNILQNVERHKHNNFFLCIDVKDFFPSIPEKYIYTFFNGLGYNHIVSSYLTKFCTYQGGLPQGGVTSPALSNLINIRLDRRITGYVSKRNIIYTRYADDITLSASNPDKLMKAFRMVNKIINEEGYSLNEKKTRLLRPGNKRKVTGLIISEDGKIGIGREQKRILRSKIYNLEAKPKNEDYHKELNHIKGWFNFLKDVDIEAYNQLEGYWKSLILNLGQKGAAATE